METPVTIQEGQWPRTRGRECAGSQRDMVSVGRQPPQSHPCLADLTGNQGSGVDLGVVRVPVSPQPPGGPSRA